MPAYVIRDQPVEQLSSLELSLKVLQASRLQQKMTQPQDEDCVIEAKSELDNDPRVKAYREKYFQKLNEQNLTHASTFLKVIRAVCAFFHQKFSHNIFADRSWLFLGKVLV